MKKKKYITPNVEIISTEMQQNLLAGSVDSSMDSDESEWEVVDNSDPSLSGRSATGLSKSYNSDFETGW
ncbi:hypothetical protein ABVC70_08505 [Hoylesella timonensis]|uniref:hypothetical protein n=1 Tax=Hoylesella timonensis TaxID=386414 RepID=UPI00336A9A3A